MHPTINSILLIIVSVLLMISSYRLRGYDNEYINQAKARYNDLQKNAPETLRAPARDQFISDDCYQRATSLFAEYGDWSTQGNYSEMELCK